MIGQSIAEAEPADPPVRNKLPSIAILDPSPFRRACVAAILAPFADGEIHTSGIVRDLPADRPPALILLPLEADEERLRGFGAEVAEMRGRHAKVKIAVIADDPELFVQRSGDTLSQLAVLLPANIDVALLGAALQLAQMDYRVMPRQSQQREERSTRRRTRAAPEWYNLIDHPLLKNCTPKQREVIERLAHGLSNREIAQQMQISESTVKAHIRMIMELLNASNRTQIVSKLIFAET